MKKSLVCVGAAMLMALTGCGSSEAAQDDNTFTVGMECGYAPFNWQTSEQTETSVDLGGGMGYCDGYDIMMAKEIADEMGKELVVKKVAWDGLQPAVASGEIDAIIAGMTANEEREEGLDFTTPYYESEGMVMIVRKGGEEEGFTSIQDFSGKKVIGQKNTNYDDVIDQIECRQRTTRKLHETLLAAPRFRFPSVLSSEQATSDALASFHAQLCTPAQRVLDMTCGLGIDTFHIAQEASCVTALEINPTTAACAAHNASLLGLNNITVLEGDSVEFLNSSQPDSFDAIFIDPARRGSHGRRLFALADCSPDVTAILPQMLTVAPKVIIKASPMLDIKHTLSEISNVSRIIAIGDRHECKELVVICERDISAKEPTIISATITDCEPLDSFSFTFSKEETSHAVISDPKQGQWLHEPFPSVFKTGPFNLLSSRFGLNKIAPNSHLYTSDNAAEHFPGSSHRIIGVFSMSKNDTKALREKCEKADISTRNFPLKPEELLKKIKLKQGGTNRIWATRTASAKTVLILTAPE